MPFFIIPKLHTNITYIPLPNINKNQKKNKTYKIKSKKMAFFGVELNAQVNRLIGQIKLTLNKNKYNPNFRTIYRSFVKYDADQTGVVSLEQFDRALQENGIFLKKFQVQAFQKAFDYQGKINWFGFLSVLRDPMNQFRTEVVNQIFTYLDTQNSGKIHLSQISKKFNCSQFLEFKLQQKSKQKIQKQLFSLVPLTPDGYITRQQFINFYNDLSLNILEDETFAKFVSSHWKYEYKAKPSLSVEELKQAIRVIRFKLIQMTGGTHEEYILKQVFNEFDTNKNGSLNQSQLYTMLVKLEIPTESRLVKPLLKKLDKSGNGVVEYDQFKNFLFFDPYHI